VATDEQLAEAAQRGSAKAFDELVERYQGRLLRFLLGRCNSRADAEDAVQDTFVNVFRYLHSYDPQRRFSTWLYRIALRNASRQPQQMALDPVEPVDSRDPLVECIEKSDRQNLWLVAKRALAAEAYSALWLRYVEDLPVRDIAQAMDRSLAWTKVSLMRSRRRLQTEMRKGSVASGRSKSYEQA